ncbi:hypothetical protein Tco_1092928 [Tanacetum coccineum]|uniref:Uncharacterized protein n=1 Tax=Tanacetum coccineum TaxID=301880 RepID=A0ABQ5ICJ5_9ASTR
MAEEVGVETVEEVSIVEGEDEEVMDSLVMDSVSLNGKDGRVENKSSMGSRLIVTGEIVVEWLLVKLVGLLMYSPMVERLVDREEKRFLD